MQEEVNRNSSSIWFYLRLSPYYNQRDDYDDRYYYEEEPTQYNDEEEYIEPPRKTKNQNVVFVVNLQDYNEREHDYEDYHHITQNNDEQDFNDDIEEDKYNQYPKRAVTSEYQQSSNEDDTSGVLSRQRKYKYKSKIVCRMKLMMMKIM